MLLYLGESDKPVSANELMCQLNLNEEEFTHLEQFAFKTEWFDTPFSMYTLTNTGRDKYKEIKHASPTN